MTELDLEIPGLAAELIEEYGKVVTFANSAIPAYDTASGIAAPAGQGAALSVKAIVEADKGQALRMGLVEGADFKLTIAAQSLSAGVSTEDKITVDGTAFRVVTVKPVLSGELIALYEIWIAR